MFLPSWSASTKNGNVYTRENSKFAKDFSPWDVERLIISGSKDKRSFSFNWLSPFECEVHTLFDNSETFFNVSYNGPQVSKHRAIYFNRADIDVGHLFMASGFKYHLQDDIFFQMLIRFGVETGWSIQCNYILTAKEFPKKLSNPIVVNSKTLLKSGKCVYTEKIELSEITSPAHNYTQRDFNSCDPQFERLDWWE